MFGYHRRYLRIRLPGGESESHPLEEAEARAYLGGSGLATRWLYRHSPAGLEPLSPANPLVLASCPLVDSGLTTTAKAAFAARSPQSGLLGESLLSSHFAIQLKRTGWDGFVIEGGCDQLSALVVDGDAVRVLPVADLAGVSAGSAEHAVRERLGPGFQVAAIGPAGEQLVRYATISHDGRHAGRTGLGAVMGAKRLKAIAVRGNRRAPVWDAPELARIARGFRSRSLGPETAKYRLLGTAGNLLTFDRLGILPARNFTGTGSPAAAALTGEGMALSRTRERTGCAACTIGCEHRFVPEGGGRSVRAEYETLFALGPLLGVEDPDQVLEAARLCDEYGMDTLSLGGTLAWAMECRARGVLASDGFDGADLRFGNGEAVLEWIPRIARKESPLGELLAEGSCRAAARIGSGSEAWAMHVKGLELPGYEPRALKTLALGLAVGARGACHNRSGAYDVDLEAGPGAILDHAAEAARSEDRAAVMDALVVCKFLRRCFHDFYGESAAILGALTGWDVDDAELRAAGARIVSLKRLYNQREGASRADDTLPPRLLGEALAGGARDGASLSPRLLEELLDGYYQARGWTRDGRLSPEAAAGLLDNGVGGARFS